MRSLILAYQAAFAHIDRYPNHLID
jgi:hypothetical protein